MMYTHKPAGYRFWTTFVVFLHLVAMFLPASSASLFAQANTCAGESLPSANVLASAVVSADQEVEIPKEKVDLAVFSANWRSKLTDAKQVENLIFDLFVVYSDKITGSEGFDVFAAYRTVYNGALETLADIMGHSDHHDLIIHTMLNVALDIPEMAPAVPFVWNELTLRGSRPNNLELDQQIGQSAVRYNLSDRLLERTPEILARVYQCAQNIPAVAEAYNKFHGDTLNSNIGDSAKTILAKNPALSLPPEILDAIGEDGSIHISLNDLKGLGETEFAKLHASIDEMQETLAEIDQQQDEIIDYLKDQELKAKWQAVMKKKAEQYQLKLDAIQSGISIISTIAAQIDPKFAKRFSVTASSSLQVGVAINGWLKAVSGLKGLDKVTSLSTVVMTGNVLGAIMNVVGLFSAGQPTPEQMILEEIGRLRQQVDQLRTEMHDRFDRIDQGLNNIYTTMHERFDQIDIQLGKINGNIQEVQQSLATLDLKLSRIERNNFEFLNVLGRRPLLDAINGGLGYEQRTGEPMPYQPDFVNFENVLHGWATIHAFDAVNAGPTQRDYSDAQMLDELNTYPLDANINYINGWLLTHGMAGIANKRLPSPRDWLFASRAYTQLGLEWPEHIKRIDPQRQTTLKNIGVDLEAAMQNLSTRQTMTGTIGNKPLFSSVMTQYTNKLDVLESSLASLESAFINDLRANRLQRSEPFDLYGGVDQAVVYQTSELGLFTCGDLNRHGSYSYAAPDQLKALIPNYERYNLAEYLRLGKLSVCLSDEWINPIETCQYDPERPQDPPYCYTLADHKAILTVNFDSVPIMTQSIFESQEGMPTSGAEMWTRTSWTSGASYKTQFEALATADQPSPEVAAQRAVFLQATTNKLETALGGYQKELYGRIMNEMGSGSLYPLAVETAGGKALLENVVTLGLARAVGSDEFLHAMLFGNQQLVDDSQILQSYTLSFTQPISGANLMINPRLVIGQVADQRSQTFTEMIYKYLDAITAKEHVEAADYLANTRRALDLTMRIARLETPPTATPTPTPGGDQPTPTATATPGNDQPTPMATATPGGDQPRPTATPTGDQPAPTPASGVIQRLYLPLVER